MSGIDRVAGAVLTAILNSLWIALAAATAAWLISKLPRINAATRHLLWWMALGVVLLLPLRGVIRRPLPASWRVTTMVVEPAERMVAAVTPNLPAVRAVARMPRNSIFPLQIHADQWAKPVLLAWLVFGLIHFFRIAWSFLYLLRVKYRAGVAPEALRQRFDHWVRACRIYRPVRLTISSEIASPMATGFFRPAVMLPEPLLAQFKERELDHVLLHELAHVARRDDWSNLAARALTAVAGLHPLAAWLLRQVDRERELACDDWVVSMTGEVRPYAASLARLFEVCSSRRRTVLATGMAGTGSKLGDRIEILLGRGRTFRSRASLVGAGLAVLVLASLAMAGLRSPQWVVLAQNRPAPQQAPRVQRPVTMQLVRQAPSRGSFLAALVAAGYGNLPVDEIIALKDSGISAGFLEGISTSGWGRLTAKELIELRRNGVSPEYLRGMQTAGFKQVSVPEVIELHNHGVRPADIAQIHELGFGPYTPAEVVQLSTAGVSPRFFHELHDAGFKQVDSREAAEVFRSAGPNTLRQASRLGQNLTLQQILKLKHAGVIQ